MAYTLADYARLADSDLKRAVVDILRTESLMMDVLPFENWDALSMETIRTKTLPTVGTRKINDTWSESKGTTESVTDKLTDIGGYVDVDKLLLKARSITDQRALQTSMYTKAVALKFNNLFINGDPVTYEEEFAGLYYRLVNVMPSSQSVLAASGGLDVSADAATLTTQQTTLIEKVLELIDSCAMHSCDYLIMNNTMKMRLRAALVAKGALATTKDAFDRSFDTFGAGGPKIVDIGPTDPTDWTARIIGNAELHDGSALSGGTCTSIYAVKVGGGEYVSGFQLYPLDVQDLGMLENGVAYRTVLDWPVGIYMVNPFSCARLYGIIAA